MRTEYRDSETTVYLGGYVSDRVQETDGGHGRLWRAEGHVETVHGYVRVYASRYDRPDGSVSESTVLDFILNGRNYLRFYERAFRPRYLKTLAKRFAAEKAGTA